jgi:hypothetical protein
MLTKHQDACETHNGGIATQKLYGRGGDSLYRLGACKTLVLLIKWEVNLLRTTGMAGKKGVGLQKQSLGIAVCDF